MRVGSILDEIKVRSPQSILFDSFDFPFGDDPVIQCRSGSSLRFSPPGIGLSPLEKVLKSFSQDFDSYCNNNSSAGMSVWRGDTLGLPIVATVTPPASTSVQR